MGNNGEHEEPKTMAAMVEQAMDEARQRTGSGDNKRFANRTFSALEDKQLGVLPTMMRAIKETADYRQELKTANWDDIRAAKKAVAAIHERLMCGVDIGPIVDRIIAESAGVHSGRLEAVIRGLTHTEFNLNQSAMNKQHFWNKNKGKSVESSNQLME